MKVHSFAVWNLELGCELSHSGHVVSLYQLLPGLLVSHLHTQTQHPAGWDPCPSTENLKYFLSLLWKLCIKCRTTHMLNGRCCAQHSNLVTIRTAIVILLLLLFETIFKIYIHLRQRKSCCGTNTEWSLLCLCCGLCTNLLKSATSAHLKSEIYQAYILFCVGATRKEQEHHNHKTK